MNMKWLRERTGLRTVDVAFYLGVADSTVRNWEKGRTMPRMRMDQFIKLMRLYKCTLDELEEAMQESTRLGGGELDENDSEKEDND